jgi:plasmid stabilization system protein ParE
MSPAFRHESEASAELEDAALWYESQRPRLGLEFVQAVDYALAQIAQWPEIGRRVDGVPADVPARRVPVKRFPYHVVYLQWNERSEFLRSLMTDSREPGYWLPRIRN